MADHLQMRGARGGGRRCCAQVHAEGKSLLPIGMVAVESGWRGDIAIRDAVDRKLRAAGQLLPVLPKEPLSQAFQRLRAHWGTPLNRNGAPRQSGADPLVGPVAPCVGGR